MNKVREKQHYNFEDSREVLCFMSSLSRCCALQSKAEIKAASEIVKWLGLPSHHDSQKNWDTLKALYYILKNNDLETPVLDAGASADSAILKWLSVLGYQRLYACDIRSKNSGKYTQKNIHFGIQDLTKTNYPDNFFQAITCISVIEHGVSLDKYIREMSRLLKPGGVLLTSTDYWSEPVDCRGLYPYGKEMTEMKVFQRHELEEFCKMAAANGLLLSSPLNLDTSQRAVRWERVNREYTFAFIALRKNSKNK